MLSNLENFSITRDLTAYLADLNNSGTVEGMVFSRAIGVVSVPFTCLIDAAVHISFFAVKLILGLGVSLYNSTAYLLFPNKSISKEFELSSSLIHFHKIFDSIIKTVSLSLLSLLNPIRANLLTGGRRIEPILTADT